MAAKAYAKLTPQQIVSTHSHPKVAAHELDVIHHKKLFQHTATRRWLLVARRTDNQQPFVSTHSHPKVAAYCLPAKGKPSAVSTHSHPKVAAFIAKVGKKTQPKFQHTATRRWLHLTALCFLSLPMFQHTATRRWLPLFPNRRNSRQTVSTHSHPKVAAYKKFKT